MLKLLFRSQIALGLAQAAFAALMALAVILLARRRNIHLESDAAIALCAASSRLSLLARCWRCCSKRRAGPVFSASGYGDSGRIDFRQTSQEYSGSSEDLNLFDCGRSRTSYRRHGLGRRDRHRHYFTDSSGQHDHRECHEH